MFQQWAAANGYTVLEINEDSHLIDNSKFCVTINDAKKINPTYPLRFRFRNCKICYQDFDITLGGFGYRCMTCRKFAEDVKQNK